VKFSNHLTADAHDWGANEEGGRMNESRPIGGATMGTLDDYERIFHSLSKGRWTTFEKRSCRAGEGEMRRYGRKVYMLVMRLRGLHVMAKDCWCHTPS
jgi:hypothetical protein